MEKQDNYLFNTKINQVKGTRADKVQSGVPRFDIIDFDLPTINLNFEDEDFENYIGSMIQAYNRYLGYSSGITVANVENTYKYGLLVYCYMRMIKRYYDAQTVTLPSGEKVTGIFDKITSIQVDNEGDSNIIQIPRIDSTVKGVSNKVWVTDYINKVEQILMPSTIMNFYDYYLGSLFDISNNSNKEAVTLLRFWIADETNSFITKPTSLIGNNVIAKITKTMFDNAYSSLETYLTPSMRNFLTTFLGWKKPNQDWTRDITGNTLSILRDNKLIETFNNIYPEDTYIILPSINTNKGSYAGSKGNQWCRYYYDFEQIMDSDESSEPVASRYYFGIDGLNLEQAMLESNEQMNTIIVDYYNYLLMVVLCSEEATGSGDPYTGGLYSVATSINSLTGAFIPANSANINEVKQLCYGNDISLKIYDFITDNLGAHTTDDKPSITELGGIIGDYGEAGDFKDQVAIFQFPVILHEKWRYAQDALLEEDANHDWHVSAQAEPTIDAVVNADWEDEWTVSDVTSSYDYTVSHKTDFESFNNYVIDPLEAHLAMHTVLFLFITGFRTYNEAISYIDKMFAGKQQSIN